MAKLPNTPHRAGWTVKVMQANGEIVELPTATAITWSVEETADPLPVRAVNAHPLTVTYRFTLSRQESRKLWALLDPRSLDALYLYRLRKRSSRN